MSIYLLSILWWHVSGFEVGIDASCLTLLGYLSVDDLVTKMGVSGFTVFFGSVLYELRDPCHVLCGDLVVEDVMIASSELRRRLRMVRSKFSRYVGLEISSETCNRRGQDWLSAQSECCSRESSIYLGGASTVYSWWKRSTQPRIYSFALGNQHRSHTRYRISTRYPPAAATAMNYEAMYAVSERHHVHSDRSIARALPLST